MLNSQGTKICSTCGKEKTLNEFNKNSRYRLGVFHRCRECLTYKRKSRRSDRELRFGSDALHIPCIKICRTCETEKASIEFYLNPNSPDGLRPDCKKCHNKMGKSRRDSRIRDPEYAEREKIISYASHIRATFGITIAEFNRMVESQKGVCKICSKPETNKRRSRLSVDHCHLTGKVRGLLCSDCNKGLGSFKDNIDLLEKATVYLKEYQ